MHRYTSPCLLVAMLLLVQGCDDIDDAGDIGDVEQQSVDFRKGEGKSESLGGPQIGKRFHNASGASVTWSPNSAAKSNGFFEDLGTNGRRCVTCHEPADGWSIQPKSVQARFDATDGTDPLFRTNDGSNSPNADVSTVAARRKAYSMLLRKGVFRVSMGMPKSAEFELIAVDDPYGYASANELSLFRRPLPSTNLKYLTDIMWDTRETGTNGIPAGLANQANGATVGHAEGNSLPQAMRKAIVDFESKLYTAQVHHSAAQALHAAGARGGPEHLAHEQGASTFGTTNPTFTIYTAWSGVKGNGVNVARRAIARGQEVFNENCGGFCHDVVNVGNNGERISFDIGVSGEGRRTSDMPLYTFRSKDGEIRKTTDPGLALVTGKWADMSKFKVPPLRGLAARPPYFHDGSAKDLKAVVDFYLSSDFKTPFPIELTKQEKEDLVAFLEAL